MRAQRLGPWFIDGADDIDLEDPRWELLYLFTLNSTGLPIFCGYFTVPVVPFNRIMPESINPK